jgi:DNA-binding LytR/AlgR family response regulator
MLNCVIIDDERFSVDAIGKYIELLPKLNIVATYTDSQLALERITADDGVDLLFMDIDMPMLSGIDLAKAVRAKTKKLIFTTAHSKYAFDAFEVEADAFLLKPFTFSKFTTTVNRLFPSDSLSSVSANDGDYFFVKNKEENLRILKVRFNEIVAFESLQNYVKIYLITNKVIVAYLTLKDVSEILQGIEGFKQFHRAFIVSTEHINFIEGTTIKMTNKIMFTVGDFYKSAFTAYLSNKLLKTSRK